MTAVNQEGALRCSRHVVAAMRKAGVPRARVVTLLAPGDQATCKPALAAFFASKSGARELLDAFRADLRREGIDHVQFTSVCTDITRSEPLLRSLAAGDAGRARALLSAGHSQMVPPQQVANAILGCLSLSDSVALRHVEVRSASA